MTELATRQLTKTYGDRPALEPLTLKVDSGAKVALVGHNGSGKTTLMKMAAGLLDPTDGSVKIGRHDAGSQQARRLLSWLSDTPTFYDDLSLWEHLEFVARLHGVVDWQQRAGELLDEIGLTARRDDIPTTFSRGLRQKAAITLAFIRPFKLMLVDEPFVGPRRTGQAGTSRHVRVGITARRNVVDRHARPDVRQAGRPVVGAARRRTRLRRRTRRHRRARPRPAELRRDPAKVEPAIACVIRSGRRGHYALAPCRNSNRSAPRPTTRRHSPRSSPPRPAEGWKVVAIVPTGGDVTAYLSREATRPRSRRRPLRRPRRSDRRAETVTADEPEARAGSSL